jgi:hypothetical protein
MKSVADLLDLYYPIVCPPFWAFPGKDLQGCDGNLGLVFFQTSEYCSTITTFTKHHSAIRT